MIDRDPKALAAPVPWEIVKGWGVSEFRQAADAADEGRFDPDSDLFDPLAEQFCGSCGATVREDGDASWERARPGSVAASLGHTSELLCLACLPAGRLASPSDAGGHA